MIRAITSSAGALTGDRVAPGETVLTRTPCDPNSAAQLRASWICAAFVAEYSPTTGLPTWAIHEPMTTIAPLPFSTIPGARAAVSTCGARTLTASAASRSASVRERVSTAGHTAALWTSVST